MSICFPIYIVNSTEFDFQKKVYATKFGKDVVTLNLWGHPAIPYMKHVPIGQDENASVFSQNQDNGILNIEVIYNEFGLFETESTAFHILFQSSGTYHFVQ
jgi:hypothetical protein